MKLLFTFLLFSFILAKSGFDNSTEPKNSTSNESIKEDKEEKKLIENSKDINDPMMYKMGGCSASCCAKTASVSKKEYSKINSRKSKKNKKFGWFF